MDYIERALPIGECQIKWLKDFVGDKETINNTAKNSKSGIHFNEGQIRGDKCSAKLEPYGRLLPTPILFSTFVYNILDDSVNVDTLCPQFANHISGDRYKEISRRLKILRQIPRLSPKSPRKSAKRASEAVTETEPGTSVDDKQTAQKRRRKRRKPLPPREQLPEADKPNQQKLVDMASSNQGGNDGGMDKEGQARNEIEDTNAQQHDEGNEDDIDWDEDDIDWDVTSCDLDKFAVAVPTSGSPGLPNKVQFVKSYEREVPLQDDSIFLKEVMMLKRNNLIDSIKLKNDCGLKEKYASGAIETGSFASKHALNFISGISSSATRKAAKNELKYIVTKRYVTLRDEAGGPLKLTSQIISEVVPPKV